MVMVLPMVVLAIPAVIAGFLFNPVSAIWGFGLVPVHWFSEMLDLMNLQRIVSISISVLTAIPIYFLVNVFFKREIAILSTTIFLFSSHIIENSILGIIEPFFILWITLTIMFTFYNRGKFFYISFIFAAIATFVRYEGLLIVIPVLLSFLIKRDFNKTQITKHTGNRKKQTG